MEFINSIDRKEEAKKQHKEVEVLLSILAQKGIITEADADKVKNSKNGN